MLFSKADKNGDGKLSKDEVPERMQTNFGRIDANGDGALTPEEFQKALSRLGDRKKKEAN